jgi:hypothetical protein
MILVTEVMLVVLVIVVTVDAFTDCPGVSGGVVVDVVVDHGHLVVYVGSSVVSVGRGVV